MADPQDELAKLATQMASLTARIYQLEQKVGISPHETQPAKPESRIAPPQPYPVTPRVSSPTPSPPLLSRNQTTTGSEALESKIGKFWLNRIGILAILIGVSYFIKYAFDNGWIGPSGKITLGILAGIGLVLWSESFRSKGYVVFSY